MVLVTVSGHAQIVNVGKAFNNAMVNKTNSTINSEVNKGVNGIFDAPGKIAQKTKDNSNQNPGQNQPQQNPNGSGNGDNPIVKSATPSDFVPGTEVLLSDNFSSTNAGDFPSNWITSSSGEVRSLSGQEGNWLQFSANGVFAPNEVPDLPENFTMEYDAIFHSTPSKDTHYIFYLYSVKDKITDLKESNYPGYGGIYLAFNTAAGEIDAENFENGKAGMIDSHLVTDLLKSALANKVHVSISRQKGKLILYINGTKVFSSPNALPGNYKYNAFKFGSFFMGSDDFMLISNLTIAAN